MGIEFGSDLQENLLTQVFLQDIGGVFQNPGQKDGPQIEAAVEHQTINLFQMDGDIDDPFLHFQGKHPEKEAGRDHQQQAYLNQSMPVKYPVKEGLLGNHSQGLPGAWPLAQVI
jgi:hypothetical protein